MLEVFAMDILGKKHSVQPKIKNHMTFFLWWNKLQFKSFLLKKSSQTVVLASHLVIWMPKLDI